MRKSYAILILSFSVNNDIDVFHSYQVLKSKTNQIFKKLISIWEYFFNGLTVSEELKNTSSEKQKEY